MRLLGGILEVLAGFWEAFERCLEGVQEVLRGVWEVFRRKEVLRGV